MGRRKNPCSLVRDGVGFPLLGITERKIPGHLTMLDEKDLSSAFLAQMRRVLQS